MSRAMQGDIIPSEGDALARASRDPYQAALATWLEGRPENTRRAYATAVRDFLGFTARRDGAPSHPRDVTPLDVAGWKEDLKGRGLADSTVAQRLSALSSYYNHLQRPQSNGTPLQQHNPVDGVGRDDLDVNPYERAHKMSLEAFKRVLEAIETETEVGARDYAIFLFYTLCGRRRSEVVELRGRDLDLEDLSYLVRLEGGKVKRKELPPPLRDAIEHYLDVADRELSDEMPVFTATPAGERGAQYLREYYGVPEPEGEQPITGEAVAQALDRYAERAGLDAEDITLHSLRHLGAELYHEASGDVHETQKFLDHAHLDTTQIYLEQLTGEEHRHWQAMANALGCR